MTTFTIPRLAADRLSRLGLACETGSLSSLIAHIGVRITPQTVRFSATDGKILAGFVVPIEDFSGDATDLILDREQFTTALKLCSKPAGRVQVATNDQEARLTNGSTAAVARRINGTFPSFDHIFTRTAGKRWVPTMGSLSGDLMATAQKIAGSKRPLVFASPVDPDGRLERLWAVPGAKPDETLPLATMRAAVTAPAYWCDHELVILVMPINRSDAERQLDLSPFVLPQAQVAAVAA